MTEVTIEQLYNHLKTLGKQWFYDKTEIDTNIIAKSNTSGILKNDGTVDTNIYLTQHQDISGKANSSDMSSVAFSGSYNDLTGVPLTFTPSSHTHGSDELTDNTAYTNLDTSANSTQDVINSAVDTKIGALLDVELIEVTDNKGTASASTMNKLYLTPETDAETNDAYEIFVTVRTGTSGNYTYSWEKVDKARIDLSGYALDTHTHGNLTRDGKIGTSSDNFITTTTGGLATNSASIGNITTSGAIGSTSGLVATTTTGGVVTTSSWITKLDELVTSLIAEGVASTTGLQDIFTLKLDLTRNPGQYNPDNYFRLCYYDMSFVTTNPSGSYTIDWGDGTVDTIVGTYDDHGNNDIDHEYDSSLTSATITIPNVVAIPDGFIYNNTSYHYLDEITIPSSVTEMEALFTNIDGNDIRFKVNLMWDNANDIPTGEYIGLNNYNEEEITEITIPNGTTSLYVAKGYPSDKLVERSA